jgi:hypothetical protein
MNEAYEINAPGVSGEIIDGEAIVLHLKKGTYFSMEGSAALIWAGILQRMLRGDIARALASRFRIGSEEALRETDRLIEELLTRDLIRRTQLDASNDRRLEDVIPDTFAYAPPVLETFTDMHDLLLLDPIHEVDEAGWPMAPRQAQA